jgi:hypothetical protein
MSVFAGAAPNWSVGLRSAWLIQVRPANESCEAHLADDRDRLGRGDVKARSLVVVPRGSVEILFNDLFSSGESEATAHQEIMADRSAPT